VRIALVSSEYAGVSQGGGIGTYMRNVASMLAMRGHDIEVFCSSENEMGPAVPGVRVNSVVGPREIFAESVVAPFLARHHGAPFDVVESAEYGADVRCVMDAIPAVAQVVKLHTPSYQITRINEAYLTRASKVRFIAGAIRRFELPRPYWNRYDPTSDPEMHVALAADEVVSPSAALLELTTQDWQIDRARAAVIPNTFAPSAELLTFHPDRMATYVTFMGKLEVRKGVLEIAQAIPAVLSAVPSARFRFVGRALRHPATGEPLDLTMRRLAGRSASARMEFVGAVTHDRIASYLLDTTIGVFPSYWENFPYVCLETMAAGCAVVGSSAGGMSEIIEDGRSGLLVPPRNYEAIAKSVIALLLDHKERAAMGAAARTRVTLAYSPQAIGPLQEASYGRALTQARSRSARKTGIST
jgi:glycogen synthase